VQEGNTDGAKEVLLKALVLKPGLARANFFYGRVLKEEGKYDDAAQVLQSVLTQFPRDRVVRNELGRVLFLQKRYTDAVAEFQKTLAIDPEDLQANYNLMLCYTGLGDEAKANEHKDRYMRFKADEAAQALTGAYRQKHPEDNNERQAVHEHVSVALGPVVGAKSSKKANVAEAKPARKVSAGAGQ
jgi:tetratricopeptide (TPR) repeat protein